MAGGGATRRDLGRRLPGVRKAAGSTQARLGAAVGYSRSTVSNAEIGHPDVARVFWARCDQVLKTGKALAREVAPAPGGVPAAARPAAPGPLGVAWRGAGQAPDLQRAESG